MSSTNLIVADESGLITAEMSLIHPKDFGPQMNEAFHALRELLIGFDEVLLQAMHALASSEHCLWIAPPGRAKSMAAELVFSLFPDASLLPLQVTKEMPQAALFGQIIPKRLIESGEEVYNLEGGLADVHFAFLDELLDGSDWTLRSILNIINERKFRSKSMGEIDAPLHSVIATTNFFRNTGALEAVVDRFLARAIVPAVDNIADRVRLGKVYVGGSGKGFKLPKLNYADLLAFAEWVESPNGVYISPAMMMLHFELMREFVERRYKAVSEKWAQEHSIDLSDPDNAQNAPDDRELGVAITPRTSAKALDFIRATAGFNGRDVVQPDDLRSAGLAYCVINDGSGSTELWTTMCDEYLHGLSDKVLRELEQIAEVVEAVGEVKGDRGQDRELNLSWMSQPFVISHQTVASLRQHFKRLRHPAITMAMAALEKSIDALDEPTQPAGIIVPGW